MLNLFNKVRWQNSLRYDEWKVQVASAKASGVGVDDGYYRKGITALVVPVFCGDRKANFFIGANAVSEQLGVGKRRELVAALKQAAQQIGKAVGGETPGGD